MAPLTFQNPLVATMDRGGLPACQASSPGGDPGRTQFENLVTTSHHGEETMTDDIDALRARSDELPQDDPRVVDVYEAILRLEEGDVLATRGLALALVKLGDLGRAEEVIQEALLLHPNDEYLQKRAEDVALLRRAEQKPPNKSTSAVRPRGPATWIKVVHYDGTGWAQEPGDEIWLSDPGQRDANGNRLYTAADEPWGRPSWRVGEQAGVYLGGTQRVPFLVEIIKPPEFNPAFVQAASWAQDDDGERWPWVTWFRILKAVDVNEAPTLEGLGIATSSMQQRARLRTDEDIHRRLVAALDAAS